MRNNTVGAAVRWRSNHSASRPRPSDTPGNTRVPTASPAVARTGGSMSLTRRAVDMRGSYAGRPITGLRFWILGSPTAQQRNDGAHAPPLRSLFFVPFGAGTLAIVHLRPFHIST